MLLAPSRRLQIRAILLAAATICVCAGLSYWHSWPQASSTAELAAGRGASFVADAASNREQSTSAWAAAKGIPCIVHQSWKSSKLPSDRAVRWRNSWQRCMPDCQHRLWTDDDNRQLISDHYQWLLPVYDGLKQGVRRADLARYVYLLHHGGIYADLDAVCVRDFRHLLRPWRLVFGGMRGTWLRSVNGTYVQNSFMASEPGHPFWMQLLIRIVCRYRQNPVGGAEETTGPLILMEELQQYLNGGQTGGVKIFPPHYFNPFSWITNRRKECKTHGGMSEAEERACVATFSNSFVVQMHMKSWGGGKA